MASRKTMKSAIESMMFVWGEPLSVKDVADIFNVDKKEIYECFRELMEEYDMEGRGIVIREINKAFQFTTRPENLSYIERLCTPVRHKKLSQSALETLAIVAYRQPVTKGEIEAIRGIRCDRVMEGLVKKDLVREVGRSDAVGRPILYGTTDTFLMHFGFESLKELPDIKDIEGLLDEEPAEADLDSVLLQQISLDDLSAARQTEAAADQNDEAAADQTDEAAADQTDEAPEHTEAPVDQTEAAE